MTRFFKKSGMCAKKRLIDCIGIDRRGRQSDEEKIKEEFQNVLSKYFELDGEVTFEINTQSRNRRYITAGAFIK